MFKVNKTKKISYLHILKKVNYKLTSNFFSLEEFSQLKFRRAYKVIKLIAKINNIKLNRHQLKSITKEIQILPIAKPKTNDQIQTISSLFNWNLFLNPRIKSTFATLINYLVSYIFIFRLNRQKIFRI